jgi:hypothetical protein
MAPLFAEFLRICWNDLRYVYSKAAVCRRREFNGYGTCHSRVKTEDDEFLMAIKIRSTTPFGGEVKPLVPCHKILCHVKTPTGMKRGTSYAKFTAIFAMSLLITAREIWWMKSGMISTQMETHNTSVIVAVYGTPCAILPRNSYSKDRVRFHHVIIM